MNEKNKIVDGVYFHLNTNDEVIKVLLQAMRTRKRIKIDLGWTDTEKSWNEISNTMGYVGKTTGREPILILVHNTRSSGGGAILTDSVIKITTSRGGTVLYQHPLYHQSI